MKIYGRTRYQTQAFVDQNCWIHSFQDPATLDGVLLAAQSNIDGPDYPNFYTSFCTSDFGPLPHSHTPGLRAGPGQSPWGGRAPGPPTMSGHCIYPLDPSSSSACQKTELGPTDKKKNATLEKCTSNHLSSTENICFHHNFVQCTGN